MNVKIIYIIIYANYYQIYHYQMILKIEISIHLKSSLLFQNTLKIIKKEIIKINLYFKLKYILNNF